jgi:hypothetical protein
MLTTGGFVDMAIKTKLYTRVSWVPLLALAMLFPVGTVVSGQTMPPTQMPPGPPAPMPRQGDNITPQEVADMDRFLDSHPEISEQLGKDPSLIDNRRWVADHPALQQYLQEHPRVADAFRANPNLFMRDENRHEWHEGDRDHDRDHGITRQEVTDMDRFLDSHPEIAEQLRKDPSLIDNRKWVADHPALQEYLQKHPEVAEEFRAHPDAFMRDEERYDRHDGDHDRDARMNVDERNRGELTSFGQFLGGHASVAAELSSDPSLATNKEYLASHPELDEYLKAHPAMSQQLAENPQAVMSSNWVQQRGGFSAKPVGPTPKPKSTPEQ